MRKMKLYKAFLIFLACAISACFRYRFTSVQSPLQRAKETFFHAPMCATEASDSHFFKLKSGWRIKCTKDFTITAELDRVERHWEGYLFAQSNAVTEGIAPSLGDMISKRNFHEYQIYGKHVEAALGHLFLSTETKKFILNKLVKFQGCSLVVVTASFGAQDRLHVPLHTIHRGGVCFVAFIDAATQRKYNMGVCEKSWNVLVLPRVVWTDPRMKTRVVRALLPFFFPHAGFSIWVDSKLQLQEDPILLIHKHLIESDSYLAVSENHVRKNIFEEGEKLFKMLRSSLSVNETYNEFRAQHLRRCLDDYRGYSFSGDGLPDAGLLLRVHSMKAVEFSMRWAQEILEYPFGRDQISFPFVTWKYGGGGVNLFDKCWYIQAVREVGHESRTGASER